MNATFKSALSRKLTLPALVILPLLCGPGCKKESPAQAAKTTTVADATKMIFPYGGTPDPDSTFGGEEEFADLLQLSDLGDEEAKEELDLTAEFAFREARIDDDDSFGGASSPSNWRPAASLMSLRAQLKEIVPNRSKVDDGMVGDPAHMSRKSDHNPWVKDGGNGVVTAYDITHSPSTGCDAGVLAESLVNSKDSRIKYVIWNRRIANKDAVGGSAAWAWRPYNGKNPHNKHLHLSVMPSKDLYDATRTWNIKVK